MPTDGEDTTGDRIWVVRNPASVREDLDLDSDQRLRWSIDPNDRLFAEVVRECYGITDQIEPVDIGETSAVEATETADWS